MFLELEETWGWRQWESFHFQKKRGWLLLTEGVDHCFPLEATNRSSKDVLCLARHSAFLKTLNLNVFKWGVNSLVHHKAHDSPSSLPGTSHIYISS